MKYVDPPFELGQKLQGVDADSIPINLSWLGQVFEHPAQRLTGGPGAAKSRFTGKPIKAVILRNISGVALSSKKIARLAYDTAGASTVSVGGTTYNETNIAALEGVDGYAATSAEQGCVIIDPFLPSGTTVADNEIFWGILEGRVLVELPLSTSDMNGAITVGRHLVAATGTTSQGTGAGRISGMTASVTSSTTGVSMAANIIGYALSAATSQQTTDGQEILINACIRY